jgi:glycosyltransferase involved in cell wall biosynthesis
VDDGRVIALFPWGDVIEEFLDPIGLTLDDFAARMTGGWLFGYAAALQAVGHRPVIVCASERIGKVEWLRHAGTGTPIWIAPGRRAIEGRSRSAYSLRRWVATPLTAFRQILKRTRSDILLAQEYENPRFDALALLAIRLGIPLFATFQGGDLTLSGIEARVRPFSLRASRGLIVASAAERTRLAAAYPRLRLNVAAIPNPLDLTEWKASPKSEARAALGLPDDLFLAVSHGRIDIHRKGQDLLLKAWSSVDCETPRELVIIGSGQDREKFAAMLGAGGLRNVRWISDYTTDRALIRRWLSAADIHVTASRVEGMPVAPLEAMACGLPLVATDAQGIEDILAEGEASGGIMVQREDHDGLAGAIKRLMADTGLRLRLGSAARRRVEAAFSIPVVGAALDSFLTGHPPARGRF